MSISYLLNNIARKTEPLSLEGNINSAFQLNIQVYDNSETLINTDDIRAFLYIEQNDPIEFSPVQHMNEEMVNENYLSIVIPADDMTALGQGVFDFYINVSGAMDASEQVRLFYGSLLVKL